MKSRTWMSTTVVCLFVGALTFPVRPAAQNVKDHPAITTFDAPGAGTGANQGTFAYAINPKGTITGFYVNANSSSHGFLRDCDRDGHDKNCETGEVTITTVDVPGAGTGAFQGTNPASINPEGAITGSYSDATDTHGFLRTPDGEFATFDAPGAGTADGGLGTFPVSINPRGAITGYSFDANLVVHGFLRECHKGSCRAGEATITTIDVPGAGSDVGQLQGTYALAINPKGAITGYYIDANNVDHGFLRTPEGTLTKFDVPGAGTGFGMMTLATAINPKGAITGYYFLPIQGNPFGGNIRGFLRNPDGTFSTFDAATYPPCCIFTYAQAVNPKDAIAGYDNDGHSTYHGFVRARNGTITTFDAPGAGLGFNQGTRALSINPDGAITGYFSDANAVYHGFLRASGEDQKTDQDGENIQ